MSQILLNQMSSNPSAPVTGKLLIFSKSNKAYSLTPAGIVNLLTQDAFGFNILLGDGLMRVATGLSGHLEIPFDCSISSVRLLASSYGDISIDLWKSTYGAFPPSSAGSIVSGNYPAIVASGITFEDTLLAGWTTSLLAGDILGVYVRSATGLNSVTLSIRGKKV
jgi:hypothetical protein